MQNLVKKKSFCVTQRYPSVGGTESVEFYARLGLRQIVDSPPNYARFETDAGTTFSLHKDDAASASSGVVVYFEVPELDSVVQQLTEKGFVFDDGPTDQRWLWREAYLRDPAGNRLCLYHAGENRRFPPWRIERDDGPNP